MYISQNISNLMIIVVYIIKKVTEFKRIFFSSKISFSGFTFTFTISLRDKFWMLFGEKKLLFLPLNVGILFMSQ